MNATYPMVSLRNAVLFPYAMMPITVGRESSQEAIRLATESEEGTLFVVTQRDPVTEEPGLEDLYQVGTLVRIQKIYQHGRRMEVLLTGIGRARLVNFDERSAQEGKKYLEAEVEVLPPLTDQGPEVEALHRELVSVANSFLEMAGQQGQNLMPLTSHLKEATQLAYFAAPIVGLDIEKQQQILEADTRQEVLEISLEALRYELEVTQLRREINTNTKEKLDQEQKEAILRRQLRSIREELGCGTNLRQKMVGHRLNS